MPGIWTGEVGGRLVRAYGMTEYGRDPVGYPPVDACRRARPSWRRETLRLPPVCSATAESFSIVRSDLRQPLCCGGERQRWLPQGLDLLYERRPAPRSSPRSAAACTSTWVRSRCGIDQVDNDTQFRALARTAHRRRQGNDLAEHGIHAQDELEQLPHGEPAHWITNRGRPHIVHGPDRAPRPRHDPPSRPGRQTRVRWRRRRHTIRHAVQTPHSPDLNTRCAGARGNRRPRTVRTHAGYAAVGDVSTDGRERV